MFFKAKKNFRARVSLIISAYSRQENYLYNQEKVLKLCAGGIDKFYRDKNTYLDAAILLNFFLIRNIHYSKFTAKSSGPFKDIEEVIVYSSIGMIEGGFHRYFEKRAIVSELINKVKDLRSIKEYHFEGSIESQKTDVQKELRELTDHASWYDIQHKDLHHQTDSRILQWCINNCRLCK